jgi:formate hydrogenlyase subunit 6/NADH:ubiquinone oxidoreductase subunit I
MRLGWVLRGLRTGVVTTRYPAHPEAMPEEYRGRPVIDPARCQVGDGCTACVDVCPSGALRLTTLSTEAGVRAGEEDGRSERPSQVPILELHLARCIMCGLCAYTCPDQAIQMSPEFELAARALRDLRSVFVGGSEPQSVGGQATARDDT